MMLNFMDPIHYRWIVKRNPTGFAVLSGQKAVIGRLITKLFAFVFVAPLFVYGFFWLIARLSGLLAVWISFLLGVFFLAEIVLLNLVWFIASPSRKHTMEQRYRPSVSILLLGCVLFLSSSPDSPFVGGFTGQTGSFVEWFYFTVDNLLRVLLLDVLEIFEVQFSTISPLTWQARTLTVIMRALIAVGTVELIISLYKTYTTKVQTFYGSAEECFQWLDGNKNAIDEDDILVREAIVIDMEHPESVLAVDFLTQGKKVKKMERLSSRRSSYPPRPGWPPPPGR